MVEETLFTKIIRGDIPSTEVYSDEEFYAFRDINPCAPTHILIVPRKPLPSIAEAKEEDATMLGRLLLTAAKIARQEGLSENGYRLVINMGDWGGQTVFHLHLHLIGGREMGWPPG